MTNFLSFVILGLLFYGRKIARQSPRRHARWMMGVIFADVSLIVYLVIAREALDRLEPTMPLRLIVHLFFAVSTVVLYGVAVFVGLRRLRGLPTRIGMKQLDRLIVPSRTLTLVTSLWLLFGKESV